MTKALAPVHRPPESSGSTQAVDDLRREIEALRATPLRVQAGQTLATGGRRVFRVAEPLTDVLDLLSGNDNVIPHGLGRPVTSIEVTPLGNVVVWLEPLPAGFDENRFVCLRSTSTRSARVRVR